MPNSPQLFGISGQEEILALESISQEDDGLDDRQDWQQDQYDLMSRYENHTFQERSWE